MLPGGEWVSPHEARLWLKRERERLGWSHKDVERSFCATASESDLYIGPGGGALFDRATVARVRRFEDGGEAIPDWLYWMPLAIIHSAVPSGEPFGAKWEWERANIPGSSGVRQENEEADFYSRTPYLRDDQLDLIASYDALSSDLKSGLCRLARSPEWIALFASHIGTGEDGESDESHGLG